MQFAYFFQDHTGGLLTLARHLQDSWDSGVTRLRIRCFSIHFATNRTTFPFVLLGSLLGVSIGAKFLLGFPLDRDPSGVGDGLWGVTARVG